jgi:4-amino-4-deoxy-L-arabinose transferase-like glycosyltransferase
VTPLMWAAAAGVALGFAYTLSPLTVLVVAALVPLWRWVSRDLDQRERQWLLALVGLAVMLRLAAIAGLFLSADPDIPYANFFGDEEFFKRKTTWLRNVSMGIPISTADYAYAFDMVGESSYLQVLMYIQALVGLAPYGIHVLNAGLYLVAVLVMYRLARIAFGGLAAQAGLALLLFLPSLFTWSISALKEPLYFLLAASVVAGAWVAARARVSWRLPAFIALAIGGLALQTLREGGLVRAVAGVVVGDLLSYVIQRPRVLIGLSLAAPVVIVLAFTRPAIQERALGFVHQAAEKHWGHINTPGLSYKLMPSEFYEDRRNITAMSATDAGRYTVRAVWAYITVPLPWEIESRSALAYLPEQIVWYCVLLLLPFGIVAGFRRDPLLTSLLLAHGAAAVLVVAVSGGNVGTLIRHRGLAMPYLAWLAGLGAVSAAQLLLARPRTAQPVSDQLGLASKAGLTWR